MMHWWDKVNVTASLLLIFFVVACMILIIVQDLRDSYTGEEGDIVSDFNREYENIQVERRGWREINDDLRKKNEELQRQNIELRLECQLAENRLGKVLQNRKVVTLEDIQKELEAVHGGMESYISEQDQVLAAYTTGNFIVENTEKLQVRLAAMSDAEDCIRDALNYVAKAKTTIEGE